MLVGIAIGFVCSNRALCRVVCHHIFTTLCDRFLTRAFSGTL
jgi:hypothetical protein